ncbi:MAG: transcription antitermination factor NusB [Alphaproteobacteria bacterium]|nr:transcription antitermination factor NusB [Alphaproteobacteria bacterium]
MAAAVNAAIPPRKKSPAKAAPAKAAPAGRRGAARLAAVQALYQLDINGGKPDAVIQEFVDHRLGRELDGDVYGGADETLFRAIVAGAATKREELDNMIAAVLPEAWPLDRLETILREILRCGVYELAELPEIPGPVVISEYVGVADAFYQGKEPGMVNAVLDRLARELRATEAPRQDAKRNAGGGEPPAA